MTRSRPRRGSQGIAFLALFLAIVASVWPAPELVREVEGAAPELQITSAARYDVQPDRSRIHVTVDTTITNTHRDTGGTRTYFDTAYLAVLPGAANFSTTSPGAAPTVKVRSSTRSYTLLTIGLGRRLFAGKHTPLRVQFDLLDKGGTALRDVRVGQSLVAFPVWAFATEDTPGSSVTVAFPPGYNVEQQVGGLPDPTTGSGGRQVWSSGALDDPLSFYAYFVGDQPGAFTPSTVNVNVGPTTVPVTVRAWTDDPTWGSRVAGLVKRGMPALATAIGLPYTGSGLVVQESVSRTIGGYAGIFDPVAATIQVAYYADPFVVLHETAHAWFNGRLASERWILEAFASWYAEQAAVALNVAAAPPVLSADLRASAIPLNAWPGVGRADETTEDYAYAATFVLAGSIAARAGADGLRSVWDAAAADESAYQPFRSGAPVERVNGPPDWRGFLDLLEERTNSTYDDLWRRWVVRPDEVALLSQRAAARSRYAAAVVAAGSWELPPSVRAAMSAWQFDQAQTLIAACDDVLVKRGQIEEQADAAGLTVPSTLQTAFEGTGGPAAAGTEADLELSTIAAIAAAESAGAAISGPIAQMGLLGVSPDELVVRARAEFAAGNMSAAQADATSALSSTVGSEAWNSRDLKSRPH